MYVYLYIHTYTHIITYNCMYILYNYIYIYIHIYIYIYIDVQFVGANRIVKCRRALARRPIRKVAEIHIYIYNMDLISARFEGC